MNTRGPEVWGAADISLHMRVARRTVERWIAREDFPEPVRVGNVRVWHADQVRDWRRKTVARARAERAF